MEWWIGWVIAGCLGLPAAIYYALRLQSRWKENKQKQRQDRIAIKDALKDITSQVRECEYLKGQSRLWGYADSTLIPKGWQSELRELAKLAKEYEKWRWESWRIIKTEAELSLSYLGLDKLLGGFGLSGVLSQGLERTAGETIHKAIYEGNLSFELAKNAMLKDKWDLAAKVRDKDSGEEKELKLKEVIEDKAFHRLVEELQGLEEREPIKMLKDIRLGFLNKAQAMTEKLNV